MNIQITELTAFVVRIPLRKVIRHASHARSETENIIVRCALSDGTIGYGEGVPREYVTNETADGAIELLRRSNLREQFEACADFPQAVALANNFRLQPVEGDDRGCQGNAARCALELAILDAYGKAFNRPLRDVTVLLAPQLHQPQEQIRYSGAITSAKDFKATLAAWKMRLYGFRQLKVKVGIAGHDDVARLRTIRSRCGRRMDIRIDANEAWSDNEAIDRILELEPFGITSVEQPIAHAQVDQLATIRPKVHTPIMLDESLCSMIDAQRAITGGLCDLFNIRLSKCGGFIPSIRLAQEAHRHGLGYQLGCQVGETAILSAAGRHFACSVAGIRYLEGSYDSHLVRESLGKTDITFGWGGKAPALPGPGLGIEVDPDALIRTTIRKEVL